ncbi:MAG: hypothetical protein AAF231_07980 [Pseudomonadota bacterium]
MTDGTRAIARIVLYATVVMVVFTLTHFTLGALARAGVLAFGGSDGFADLVQNILSIALGFLCGELVKRWFIRRFEG